MDRNGLSPVQVEYVILAVALEVELEFIWHDHAIAALDWTCIDESSLVALAERDLFAFDDRIAALLAYTFEYIRSYGRVSDSTHAALAKQYGILPNEINAPVRSLKRNSDTDYNRRETETMSTLRSETVRSRLWSTLIRPTRTRLPGRTVSMLAVRLLTPTFTEPHTHLDSALTVEAAGSNKTGTLEEG